MQRPAKLVQAAFCSMLLVQTGCAGTVAREQGSSEFAYVRVECTIQSGGWLSDCRVLSEDPPGMGFAEAALTAALRSRVPGHVDGGRSGAKVQWNVRFRPDEPAALDLQPPRA
ncbi:MAG: hypothetical protein RL093_1411 [Pseudomonadota bacterium]|jgi:hypothetical protein